MYGVVKNIEIPTDRIHPEFTRGFAYVEFENPNDAEKAIKHMDGGWWQQKCSVVALLRSNISVLPTYP